MECDRVWGEGIGTPPHTHTHKGWVEGQCTGGRPRSTEPLGSEETGHIGEPGGPTVCQNWDRPRWSWPMVLSPVRVASPPRRFRESAEHSLQKNVHTTFKQTTELGGGYHPRALGEIGWFGCKWLVTSSSLVWSKGRTPLGRQGSAPLLVWRAGAPSSPSIAEWELIGLGGKRAWGLQCQKSHATPPQERREDLH